MMRLIIGLILSLLVLGTGEMVARRIIPDDACMKQDELLGFSLKPYASCQRQSRDFKVSYQINSLGLRDEEINLGKKGGRRILMLGDSFTEGTGVKQEETFSAVLERELGIKVVNAGVSGYSTLQEYLWLKERGLVLQPDLVVLNVNETDLAEANKYHKIWEERDEVDLRSEPNKIDKINKFVFDKIKLLALIRDRVMPLWRQKKRSKSSVFVTYPEYWRLVESDIRRVDFLTRGRNIPLLVVFQPHGHHVSSTAWGEGRLVHGFEPGRVYPPTMPKLLETLAEEVGFEFLDLTSTFAATEAKDLYFPYDGHWTANGHKLVAETLKEFLNDHLF